MSKRPGKIEIQFAKFAFGYGPRTELYNQLIALLDTGMPTTDALQMAWDVASEEGKKPKELHAIVLSEIILAMKNGETLGKSLKPWVPQEDVMVIEAIENSEAFVQNLRDYMEMLTKKKKIKNTILGGMLMPIGMLAMVFAIVTYFGKKVVPQIAGILPVEQWRGGASILAFMANFANNYAVTFLISAIIIITAISISLPRWYGTGRSIADKFPIYSTFRMYTGISFLMSMASLIQGGTPAPDALNMLHPQANPYVRRRILRVRNQMLDGSNFGAALHRAGTGWPDRKMNLNIKIFAETQDLSAQLSRLSRNWIDKSQENVERSMSLFRAIAMFMMFATIMLIIAGVFGLQTQISSSLGGF